MGEARRKREAGYTPARRPETLTIPMAFERYPYRTLLCRDALSDPANPLPLFSPVPIPENVPQPALIVSIEPPAVTLDEGTRAMVLGLIEQGESVLLVSKQAALRDNVKRDLALRLSIPVGVV
jgi:hypothetical protein